MTWQHSWPGLLALPVQRLWCWRVYTCRGKWWTQGWRRCKRVKQVTEEQVSQVTQRDANSLGELVTNVHKVFPRRRHGVPEQRDCVAYVRGNGRYVRTGVTHGIHVLPWNLGMGRSEGMRLQSSAVRVLTNLDHGIEGCSTGCLHVMN